MAPPPTQATASKPTTSQRDGESFEKAAQGALTRLRDAARAAFVAAGGPDFNSLALSRKLSVDKSLSWRLVRFAQEGDVFAGSKHLPGDAGLRIFARAIRGGLVPAAVATEYSDALDALDAVIKEHAGSRAAFRALLANCASEQPGEVHGTEFRRSAFQANSALWGIEASTRLLCAFLTAGDRCTDVALVSGFLGLRRMRRDLSWPLARRRVLGHEGRTRERIAMPLDPSVPMDAPPLLAEYSSVSAESLRPISTEHGFWYELPEGEIGGTASVDCLFGERMPGAGPAARKGGIERPEVLLRIDMPTEHVLMDIFVDRDIPIAGMPSATLFGLLTGGNGENTPDRERQRMPICEQPTEIGIEPKSWVTPVAPRHWEVVHDCMRWLDRRPASFRVFRLALRYPIIPTALVVTTPIGSE